MSVTALSRRARPPAGRLFRVAEGQETPVDRLRSVALARADRKGAVTALLLDTDLSRTQIAALQWQDVAGLRPAEAVREALAPIRRTPGSPFVFALEGSGAAVQSNTVADWIRQVVRSAGYRRLDDVFRTLPPSGIGVADFNEELLGRGMSRRTVHVYSNAVERANRWMLAQGTHLDTASATEVRAYAETLPRTRSTLALLRSALRAYWVATGRHRAPIDAVRVPSKPRMVCRALGEDDARRLAAVARARSDRRGTAVLLGLYSALRRSEIAALRWDQVGEDRIRVVGKGDVSATVPLHPVVAEALDELRGAHLASPYVFPGRDGGPSNPTTVWGWVRAVATEAGLGQVPTHVLRHTALATALDATGDLRAVQEFARHADPLTTAGYTRVRGRRLDAVVQSIDYDRAAEVEHRSHRLHLDAP